MTPARAPRTPKPPAPPKPWRRTEPGRYASVDDRFTLASDGGGRWFVTDAEALDDLGLARTVGPFQTLEAAKTAADAARTGPAAASPLASRLASARERPPGGATPRPERSSPRDKAVPPPDRARPAPAPPPRTWLDELAERDPAGASRARRLVDALTREGLDDADALVRRDVLGDTPAVASRLLARDVLAAIARLRDPSTADLAAAVAGVLAASPARRDLPGWELVERGGPPGQRARPLRLAAEDLRDAAREP